MNRVAQHESGASGEKLDQIKCNLRRNQTKLRTISINIKSEPSRFDNHQNKGFAFLKLHLFQVLTGDTGKTGIHLCNINFTVKPASEPIYIYLKHLHLSKAIKAEIGSRSVFSLFCS